MVHKCENGKLRVHYDKKRFIIEAIVMYLPGFLMVLVLLTPFSGFSQIVHDSKTVIESFLTPDAHAKPMARMWFPDASAGEDDNDYIEKQISELAAKGFGGVEVAMIMTYGVRYDNEDTRVYGWGTDNWIKLMKKVLKAAAKVPGGFQVDATITSHWPPLLNTIDPNDDAASKELSFSVTPITADDMENGTIKLELPLQRMTAPASTFGPTAYDYFLFTDRFVSAVLVRIADILVQPGENDAQDRTRYVFDFKSLTPITNRVTVIPGAGYAAGVPDHATAASHGWNYDKICTFFGPESNGPWTRCNGKQDENMNRKRMADWQEEYQVSINGLDINVSENGGEPKAGDWVVLSTFCRGTGQSIVGASTMHNGIFAPSYFCAEGTKALTNYWEQMFARDPELLMLMMANPGNYFEDSIELISVTSYWAPSFLDNMPDGYAYSDILPTVAASKYVSSGFMGVTVTDFFSFTDDDGLADRIYEDYSDQLAELYVKHRVAGVGDWAKKTVGWGFRGQTFHLPGLEIGKGAMIADVPECDNNAKGDGIRYQAGTANIADREFLSMEAMTGPAIGYANMGDLLTELGQNYSDGITRAVLHGTPYTKTFNGYCSEWPGWLPFAAGSYGSSFTYREAYWPDFGTETGFMSRVQAVLQKGVAKIDLAVLIDKESSFDFESKNRFQKLLDSGYSYNLVSESVLDHPNAVVSNNVLVPEGPAYKALIVDHVNVISLAAMKRLVEYAKAGLPIILFESDIKRVYGSDRAADIKVSEMYARVAGLNNVKVVAIEEEILNVLTELGVSSHAKYHIPQLEATLYHDVADGTNYFYLYNNAFPDNSAMMGNHQSDRYKGEDKVLRNITVTLEGDGVPYQLDPYTGKVAQIAQYKASEGGVTFTIDRMAGGCAMIYGVTPDECTFSKVTGQKISNVEEKKPIDLSGEKWQLIIHSYGPEPDSKDPGDSKVTDVDFGCQALGKWCDIQASNEQLDKLGVSDMKYVSGTGEYTISFILPDNFGENDGAFIAYSYGRDQVGALIVNGTELPANNASDQVDAGSLFTVGQNTLTIRLHSTLYGRTYFEHSGYLDRGVAYGMGEGVLDQPVPGTYYNGLLGVSIIPYVAKDMETPNAIKDVPSTDNQHASSSAHIYNLQGQQLSTPQRGVNIVGGTKIIAK